MADNKAQAQAAKARGNAHFGKGEFKEAIAEYSQAIELDPTDHVLYSNRSGSYAGMKDFSKALDDGERCIQINPAFAKGYARRGLALFELGKYADAKKSYEEGVAREPTNESMKEAIENCNSKLAPPNPMGQLFGPSMWGKLSADPTTRGYLEDPTFVAAMRNLQSNPQAMSSSLGQDPRISQAIGVILGLGSQGFGSAGGDGDDEVEKEEHNEKPATSSSPSSSQSYGHASNETAPMEEEELDADQLAVKAKKKEANDLKEKGNELYKKKNFAEAIEFYTKAATADPTDATFLLNIAAAHMEEKNYEKAIQASEEAVRVAQDAKDFKNIAKAYARIGSAHHKQKNFDEAIKNYNSSLVEVSDPKIRRAVLQARQERDKDAEVKYLDKDKSEEAKIKGNKLFDEGKWVAAIEQYSEALKRDPTNYKVYSNRAACYIKLMEWQRGLDDCEKCLSIDPKFVKVYIRKGKIHHFLKQYHKAIECFQQGLKYDPTSTELQEARITTMRAIQEENASGTVDPQRAKEAMKDPEIQEILRDQGMNQILQQMQDDPHVAQSALKDPVIRSKIDKLIAAGILKVGSR